MQIIIKHWTDENLNSPAKKVNASIIKKYTGVDNYKGRKDQIAEIMNCVTKDNYQEMFQRVKNMELNDHIWGSSNFGQFIKRFESTDIRWIEEIISKIQ